MSSPSLGQLLAAAPTLPAQLALAALNSLVWYSVIALSTTFFKRAFRNKPWRKQWVSLQRTTAEKSFFIILDTDEAYYELACRMLGVVAQHLIGGALCFPSAYGPPSELAYSFARHGALCEMGWELQDLLVRGWQCTFGGTEGRAKNPAGLLLILGLHHCMGCSLVIPLNLYYPRNRHIHEAVCLLQGAAAVALLMQNYGYTLDTSTRAGLLRMKFSVGFVWLVVLWSRVLRFTYLFFVLVPMLLVDGNALLSAGAVAVVLAMGYVNFIFFADATRKLLKFGALRHTDDGRRVSEAAADAAGALTATRSTPGIQRWASGDRGAPPIYRWGSSDDEQDRRSLAKAKKAR